MQEEFDYSPTVKPKQIGELFKNLPVKKTKHEYEYQEVCCDIEKDFGRLVWTLPYKVGVTPYKIKKAAEIARARGIKKYPYLVGIIKRLPY